MLLADRLLRESIRLQAICNLGAFAELMLRVEKFCLGRHHFHIFCFAGQCSAGFLQVIDCLELLEPLEHGSRCAVLQERLQFELPSPLLVGSVRQWQRKLLRHWIVGLSHLVLLNVASSAARDASKLLLHFVDLGQVEQNTTPLLCQVIVRGGSGVNPMEDIAWLLFVRQDDTRTFLMVLLMLILIV